MYQISPVRDWADLALEWADLGFTMYQISPLQQVSYPFPKTTRRSILDSDCIDSDIDALSAL